MTYTNDMEEPTYEDADEPMYDEVVVDAITAAVIAAAYIGVAGFALAGIQTLWPDAPLVGLLEVTLPGIGIAAALGGVLKGAIDAALGVQTVRFWRRHRARTIEDGGDR